MKKAVSLITAAALAAGTLGTLTASAHQADDGRFSYAHDHQGYIYFDVHEDKGHIKLSDNFIYINKNNIANDGDIIKVDIYLYDHTKKVCDVIVHMCETTCNILMRNGYDPVAEFGATPFAAYNTSHPTYKPPYGHVNTMTTYYGSSGLGYYTLTGENTDDYPVGIFDMTVPKDIEAGSYYVDFAPPDLYIIDENKILDGFSGTGEVITDEDDNYVKTIHHEVSYCCENIQINISDRDIGDRYKSWDIDVKDAETILRDYSECMNDNELPDNLRVADDVNGDRVVDTDDVEMIMDYTLLYGKDEQPAVSFVDYVREQISEKEFLGGSL